MFAREHDPAVDRTQIVEMPGAQPLRPMSRTAQRPWHPMPGNGHPMLKFRRVLRMNLAAVFDGFLHALLGRHRRVQE
jgi:hypothetical protein